MIIKIGKTGNLLLMRHGLWQDQTCPFAAQPIPCGDWCPHFHEPDMYDPKGKQGALALCHQTILSGTIEDYRRK